MLNLLIFVFLDSAYQMTQEENQRSLSLDYLDLLINGQAFSDVTFSLEGRFIHAHRCILAARSLFFRKFFCSPEAPVAAAVIPVSCVRYEAFLLLLQFLYCGDVHKELLPSYGGHNDDGSISAAVDLAVDTLAAARSFGIDQLALITQKELMKMVEKASVEDVMKVLVASRKHEMQQLWITCCNLVGNSGLPMDELAKHLPIEIVTEIKELRKSAISAASQQALYHDGADLQAQKIRRMRRALDSSDVELVKLMVMGEGLNLDESLALHYAVEYCSREVVKSLLELGFVDVNFAVRATGKTPLHIAAEMGSPDMVAVLLDHHADPNAKTVDGKTPLDILRDLTSDFVFKLPSQWLPHVEPNKLRLCLELVHSAAMVISREKGKGNVYAGGAGTGPIFYLNLERQNDKREKEKNMDRE